jgi:hypothetical protein
MVSVQSRYFHLAFQRSFSDLPFSRSSRRKLTTFHAYVEEVKKKRKTKKTRAGLHECYASHRIKKTRWHTSRDSGAKCGAKHVFEYGISRISRLLKKRTRSRKVDIPKFITKIPLLLYINFSERY